MIKPFMNGEEVRWNDKDLQLKWVRPELPEIEMWVAGYGPKALAVAGRVGDGVIIQLADPEIIQWIMATARAAAEEAGRDPAALKCIVCAPSHVSDDIADARDQTRWFPAMVSNHVKDLIERYGTDGSVVPKALTDYVEARKFYDYDDHSRVGAAHGDFVTDEICDRFSVLGNVEQVTAKLRELEAIGVDHYSIYLMTHGQEETLAAYGEHIIPGFKERDGIDDAAAEQVEAWRSVAAGWERRRSLFARATALLSERMVELLEPAPGERVLELAAGPGETGFRALPLIQPDGQLLSTDVAPEMVEVARRRASELGLANVHFAVENAAALSLPDDSADAVLCRFGLMLVPEMDRAAAEIARVLRPAGRAVLAVWASSRLNPLDDRKRKGSARAGPRRSARPRRAGAVSALGRGQATVGGRGRGAPDRAGGGGSRRLGRLVARRVVGDVAGHLADALDPARAAGAERGARSASPSRVAPPPVRCRRRLDCGTGSRARRRRNGLMTARVTESSCRARSRRARPRSAPSSSPGRGSGFPRRPRRSRRSPIRR